MWLQQLPNGTSPSDVVLWIDGFGEADRLDGTAHTHADVIKGVEKAGGKYLTFDASASEIDTGSDMVGTTAITAVAWIKPSGFGEGSPKKGRIFGNGRTYFNVIDTNDRLEFTSNNSNVGMSAINSIVLNTEYFVCITRTAGVGSVCNFYINGVLNGTANQDSGTPVTVPSNVYVGTSTGGTVRHFDGTITQLIIFNKVLTVAQMGQMYNKHNKV